MRIGAKFTVLIATLVVWLPNSNACASLGFTILDLGTLGGTTSQSFGFSTVNDSGQVVGFSYVVGDSTTHHAFRTAPNAAMVMANDLGSLGGGSSAYSINASGQAAGDSPLGSAPSVTHAFRTDPNGFISSSSDLGSLGGPTQTSTGHGINSLGQVTGFSYLTGGFGPHAYRTNPNSPIAADSDLGALITGGQSYGAGINDSGQVVGDAVVTGGFSHAFRTAPNGPITPASDLGTLGSHTSTAYAINNSGQVVGDSYVTDFGADHAFRTAPNGPITPSSDLGTLGGQNSYAFSINNAGQVVGYSTTSIGASHAFFVDSTGSMQDLNALISPTSGWVLAEAHGINNLGQIAGFGTIGGQTHAFLLTQAIPEPAFISGLAFGALALFARRRR